MKSQKITIIALVLMCALVVVSVGISFITNWQPKHPNDLHAEKALERALRANEATSKEGSPEVVTFSRSADRHMPESTFASQEVLVDNESILETLAIPSTQVNKEKTSPTFESQPPDSPAFGWIDPNRSIRNIVSAGETQDREWVYGWLQLQSGFDRSSLSISLKQHSTTILGFSGMYARARIPTDETTLEELAEDPHIAGFGMQPKTLKIDPQLSERFAATSNGDELPVFITVLANNDSDAIRQSLAATGVTVGQWFADIRSYSANLPAEALDDVLQRDDVEEITGNEIVRSLLDSANAVVGIDSFRQYQESTDSFDGSTGLGVAVGVMDTGLNLEHLDFSLKEVCGANFLSNSSADENDLFHDQHGHGSHVTGILAGEGKSNTNYVGVAPGVKQIRFAKVLDTGGYGSYLDIFNAVKFLREENPCDSDPPTNTPSLVNVSLGGSEEFSDGNSLFNRKLDATVYDYDQSYVLAAGNDGLAGISDLGSTKNSITVGAVFDNGVATDFSSHGPTSDGRLSPHVAAPGGLVTSVDGDGSRRGYIEYSGTSMAAPAVAGLSAVLLENNDWTPALLKAVLMATAVRPEPYVGTKDGFPTNNTNGPGRLQEEYGMGLVTATQNWAAGDQYQRELSAGEEFSVSITIPDGVARLDVVLTWIEPPSTRFSNTVLSNFDLYLDEDANCGEGACGEHSSRSSIDNNEWILLKDPKAGEYSIKVVPVNDFTEFAKIGVAWRAIEKDAPQLALESSESQVSIRPNESFELELDVSVDEFVSAGTTLHLACEESFACANYDSPSRWHPSSHAQHNDGTYQLLSNDPNVPIAIGEVSSESSRKVSVRIPRGLVNESHTLYFVASSFNAHSALVAVDVVVDEESAPAAISPPDNDLMQDASMLSGTSGEFDVNLRLASREPGERIVQGSGGGGSITKFYQNPVDIASLEEFAENSRHSSAWYELNTPPDVAVFSVSRIPNGTAATVFESTSDGLKSIFEHSGSFSGDAFSVRVEGSHRYLLQLINPLYNAGSANVSWSLREDVQPSNDDFANAEQISGSSGSTEGTNFNSSLEGFEFYGEIHNESTWYKWTAPNTGTYDFDAYPGIALVFKGSDSSNLTRISSIPASDTSNLVQTEEGEQYYIAVVSSSDQGGINDYSLSWTTTSNSLLIDNDNYSEASSLSGESGEVTEYISQRRTLEPNEPREAGLGTLWWSWTPSESGSYTFKLEDPELEHLSMWTGDSLNELSQVSIGTVLSVDASADQTYYLAYGTDHRFAFNDLQDNYPSRLSVTWGPAPANDLRINAIAVSGTSGTTTFSHEHATESRDDPRGIAGTHSLWWTWEAPSDGWITFELDVENDDPFERQVDNVLGVLKKEESQFIATTDRSYVLSGKPETVIYAAAGEEYFIQVSLRTNTSKDPFAESGFSWNSANAPPWLKYQTHLTNSALPGMSNEVESLIAPRSIAIDSSTGTLYVIAETGLIVLTTDETTGNAHFSKLVEFADQEGNSVDDMDRAILGWDASNASLYAFNRKGLYHIPEMKSVINYIY
ncbi:MAG: S8 family serine peptidase [Gammaproteobacteria bacterium]|nr:S8 family serine peptidase [Gammaproteobacteria bacterium]